MYASALYLINWYWYFIYYFQYLIICFSSYSFYIRTYKRSVLYWKQIELPINLKVIQLAICSIQNRLSIFRKNYSYKKQMTTVKHRGVNGIDFGKNLSFWTRSSLFWVISFIRNTKPPYIFQSFLCTLRIPVKIDPFPFSITSRSIQ